MHKTWNLTYYQDGQPVAERNGVSHEDAVTELYRLSRGGAPVAPAPVEVGPDHLVASAETGELSLAA